MFVYAHIRPSQQCHHSSLQEVDPTPDSGDFESMEWAQDGFFQDLASSIPGIDEAMSFAEVMKQVRQLEASRRSFASG